jgi:putative copper export protein
MDWLSNGVMFAWYAPLLIVIGAVGAVRVFAISDGADPDGWDTSALRIARRSMPLVLLALLARLWLQTWQAFGTDQPLTLPFAAIIAILSPKRWLLLLLAACALGGTVGMTGHAAGADTYTQLLIAAHGVHVLAAGLWLGSLAIVLIVARPSATVTDTGERLAHAIDRFSPQAVVSVAALATSGIVAAWQHVNSLEALFTPYGFVFIAKVVAFGAAALCGFYNWRVVRPTLASHPEGPAHLRSMATLELVFGLAALVLTSVLTSMPMPTHD